MQSDIKFILTYGMCLSHTLYFVVISAHNGTMFEALKAVFGSLSHAHPLSGATGYTARLESLRSCVRTPPNACVVLVLEI